MRPVDTIRKPVKPVRLEPVWLTAPKRVARRVGRFFRFALVSKVGLILLLLTAVVPLAAFEAHVVNVTARIESRPCVEREIQTKTFWKVHPELWILPQLVGDTLLSTQDEANEVFERSADNAFTKLKAQLLALKFNIAFFGIGEALVPGEGITINTLAAEGDTLLLANPAPPDADADTLAERIRAVNLAGSVSTCPTCPNSITVVTGKNFEVLDGAATSSFATLSGNVNEGNRVTANFTLADECADKQVTLVAYKSPTFVFETWRANEDTVYDAATGFFGPGPNTLAVDVPACHFYLAFVLGPVIEQMGPEGSENFYSSQGRLVSADAGDYEGVSCSDMSPKEPVENFMIDMPPMSEALTVPEEASSTPTSTPRSTSGGGGGPSTSSGQADEPLVLGESDTAPTSTDAASTPSSTEPIEPPTPTSTDPVSEPEGTPPPDESAALPEETTTDVPPQEETPPPAPPSEPETTPPVPEPQPEPQPEPPPSESAP